eukprot:gene4416-6684_t
MSSAVNVALIDGCDEDVPYHLRDSIFKQYLLIHVTHLKRGCNFSGDGAGTIARIVAQRVEQSRRPTLSQSIEESTRDMFDGDVLREELCPIGVLVYDPSLNQTTVRKAFQQSISQHLRDKGFSPTTFSYIRIPILGGKAQVLWKSIYMHAHKILQQPLVQESNAVSFNYAQAVKDFVDDDLCYKNNLNSSDDDDIKLSKCPTLPMVRKRIYDIGYTPLVFVYIAVLIGFTRALIGELTLHTTSSMISLQYNKPLTSGPGLFIDWDSIVYVTEDKKVIATEGIHLAVNHFLQKSRYGDLSIVIITYVIC